MDLRISCRRGTYISCVPHCLPLPSPFHQHYLIWKAWYKITKLASFQWIMVPCGILIPMYARDSNFYLNGGQEWIFSGSGADYTQYFLFGLPDLLSAFFILMNLSNPLHEWCPVHTVKSMTRGAMEMWLNSGFLRWGNYPGLHQKVLTVFTQPLPEEASGTCARRVGGHGKKSKSQEWRWMALKMEEGAMSQERRIS